MILYDWQALNRDYKYIALSDEIFSSECAWSYDFSGTELETKYINNANKTLKRDFKIIFICPMKSIWKKCSGHKVVEFKTGWSMHHYQSSKKLLQSISYEFIERHLRKADKLQRNYYICESSKLEIYPCLSLLIPLLPTTSLRKGKNHFSIQNYKLPCLGHLPVWLQETRAAWSFQVVYKGK